MTMRPVFGLCLAAACALAACRGEQPAAKPAPTASASAASPAETGPAAYLPRANSPAGWTVSKAPQDYNADTLWEFIDGAAETYVGFGFEAAVSAGYKYAGSEVGVEIYRMSDSLHAFGIYAQERPPAAQAVPAGAEGYAISNVLNFRKGGCYVKLTAPAPDKPGPAAMMVLARSIGDKIPDGAPLPRALSAFPPANLVAQSVKFLPRDVLGQRQFTNGFEAAYQDGASVSRLVIVLFETSADAASAFARYRAFVAESGKPRPGLPKAGDEAFAADDRFSGRVFAARSGGLLAISVGASSDGAASALVSDYFHAQKRSGR